MDFIFTLYPISDFGIFGVLAILFYFFAYNIYFIILCIASICKYITITPILQRIDNGIGYLWKDSLARIKQNIHDSFIVHGNTTNTKQSIYIFHPHGMYSLTQFFHIGTEMTNWPYRNIKGVCHFLLKKIPFLMDFLNDDAVIESSYDPMISTLKQGHSMSVSLGNFTEGKYTEDNKITAIVKNRKGIFKMAIETGIPLIPVISYGEQNRFKQIYSFGILEWISNCSGIQINIPNISSLLKWCSIYKEPFTEKIETHIGYPVEVGEARVATTEDIDAIKNKYIDALRLLYKETHPVHYEDEMEIV